MKLALAEKMPAIVIPLRPCNQRASHSSRLHKIILDSSPKRALRRARLCAVSRRRKKGYLVSDLAASLASGSTIRISTLRLRARPLLLEFDSRGAEEPDPIVLRRPAEI